MIVTRRIAACLLAVVSLVTGCERADTDADRAVTARDFPRANRPVSGMAGSPFTTENQRDSVGEAQRVMDLAEIRPGMTVADIGAGEGYYTVRLAEKVGAKGRVLAEDIDKAALERLGQRIERDRLDNVSVKLGTPDDPRLPDRSFDRIFMVHMFHEVEEPYAFLWRLWPALKPEGLVVVVDIDRPSGQHGIDPLLLSCEFERVGFKLDSFKDAPELAGYYAQFKRTANRPQPHEIKACNMDRGAGSQAEKNVK
ncbi:class I SAM-dependent methyltransferase [Altererythrobacter sp. FM1]|uniref:class I SAM-dependent methyltransferase n=1 Tax=Tsuneonella flava TaxID=2055955 RepID=UPI000C80BDEF|nr:methyltransferase domain-containing protein [Tsuneonella flava]ROT95291.1 class I SAM-dependent methyltransferase [Altererythrobacter sp. FM1]